MSQPGKREDESREEEEKRRVLGAGEQRVGEIQAR